jgi:sugar phosphate isomerase/epimerase
VPAPEQSSLAVCAAAFGDLDLDEALAEIAQLGLTSIDLPTDSTFRLTPDLAGLEEPGYPAALRAALARSGITVACVSNSRDTQLLLGPHGPHTDPVASGTPAGKQAYARRYARATIALAAAVGAPMARLYFGCPDYARWLTWGGSPVSWDDNIERLAEVAIPLLEQARAAGLRLAIEPHPRQVVFDCASARAAARALAGYADVLAICLDPANIATLGYDPVQIVAGWDPPPAALHVKDLEVWTGTDAPPGPGWTRYGPQRPHRFRGLGRGGLPWPQMLDGLLAGGFAGPVFVEHEDVLLPRAQSIATAASRLRALLPASAPEGRTW